MHRRPVYIYLLNVPSFSSRYFNKIKRTSRLGRLLDLSLEILTSLKRLDKMVGRNVENANEIRADIRTRALLSRSSTDICIVYGSNSLFNSTLCRWVRKFSADVGPVISAPKSGRTKSSSSLKIVEKK